MDPWPIAAMRPPHGAPYINAQLRFGIYRDWRSETQTIYFDKIRFWNADPAGHPDWSVSHRFGLAGSECQFGAVPIG